MSYTVDPVNPAEPTDTREAGMMAAEFRAIKGYIKNTVVKSITDNKASSDDGLAAINTKLNTATGNSELPAGKGLIPIVAEIYAALYTATTGVMDKLSSVISTTNSNTSAISAANDKIANLSTTVQQLSQSFAALNTKFNQLTAAVDDIVLEFPVNSILITANSNNPSTYLNYGVWEQVCKGKYLVGVGASIYNGSNAFNFTTAGATYGYPSTTIEWSQMPPHRHVTNVLVRTSKTNGQFLTSVDGEPTLGDGVKVVIGTHPQTGEPIYGSEANGAIPAYYTNVYDGTALNTWENHKNYGSSQQGVPYTGYAGGSGINSNGTAKAQAPVTVMPLAEAYYMWKRKS